MAVVVLLLVVVGLPLLLFLPLVLSLVEFSLFGTNKVYAFFEGLGIADELGKIYEPVVEFFT